MIQHETKSYQERIKKASRSGDYIAVREEQEKYSAVKRAHGISGFVPLLGLIQIPIMITWFLSVRHMAMNPDLFPNMMTQGLLWFKDLSQYDPLFILPLLSAVFSSMNIARSPLATGQASIGGPFAKYVRFMRYFPFFGFPILMFFPAGMNLYWATVAGMHLLITLASNTAYFRQVFNIRQNIMQRKPTVISHMLKEAELNHGHSKKSSIITHGEEMSNSRNKQTNSVTEDGGSLKTVPVEEVVQKSHLIVTDGKLFAKSKAGNKIELLTDKPKKRVKPN